MTNLGKLKECKKLGLNESAEERSEIESAVKAGHQVDDSKKKG